MRILCQGDGPIQQGWRRVLVACGHQTYLWNPLTKPAFDVFDEFQPDLFVSMGTPKKARNKCSKERGWRTRVVDRGEAPPAGDTFLFYPGTKHPFFECDVAIVEDYNRKMARCLSVLCNPSSGLRVKIFGDVPSPFPQYLGRITDNVARDIYASARLTICFSEHGIHGGWMGATLSGGRVWRGPFSPSTITEAAIAASHLQGGGGRGEILRSDTYWHRVADIFSDAGLPKEAARTMERFYATISV
jgi:hypothetical protein